YSAGLSIYLQVPSVWPLLVSSHFRRLDALSSDAQNEADATFPQVIFIEPDYNDAPIHLSGHANDNHPPLAVAFGEAFLRDVYQAITSNPARFRRTVMIVTYDEHGGFFDHVPPLPIPYAPPPGASFTAPFDSTGVRVPAMVISPMVGPGAAKHATL